MVESIKIGGSLIKMCYVTIGTGVQGENQDVEFGNENDISTTCRFIQLFFILFFKF